MATCPNKNLDSWKSLVSSRGEDMAYYLWDKYEGVVPKNEYEVSIEVDVQYQLTSQEIKEADKKLDAKLLNFLSRYGVQSNEIKNFKERWGVDALGATDVLNKIIYHSVEKKLDTIPEEAVHMTVMLMGQTHPLIRDLMDNIKDWSGYQAVYDEYMPVYNNEKQVKVEALGKLITESLLQQWTNKTKEERNLLLKILKAVTEFLNKFTKPFVLKEGSYFKDAADKIAFNILTENQNFIGSPNSKVEKLNYEQAVSGNNLAKDIISRYTGKDFNYKLVGSLAIAGQGETIYRPSNAPIHDLDFTVDSVTEYEKINSHMQDINAVPIHDGWGSSEKKYKTYAYLIPASGYTFKNLNRDNKGWLTEYTLVNSNGEVVANIKHISSKETIFTKEDGSNLSEKEINNLAQYNIPVDFFIYNSESEEQSVGGFSSVQDIYFGKLTLSPNDVNERMFQREKDQEDYRTSNFNKRDIEKNEFIYFQLPKNKSIGEESNLQYQFKVVSNLYNNLDKINKLWKQIGNNNTFWNKIQQDFQIPKDQVNLLKESEGNTIEEKLTSFAANYSYTVEINTAYTTDPFKDNYSAFNFNDTNYEIVKGVNGIKYYKSNIQEQEVLISKEEFEKALNNFKQNPSQYYSNLTVPGGTNYTEKEISTPLIKPSIKGHAQFATDKGLMWSRTDEKAQYQEQDIDNLLKIMENSKILQIKCS